MPRFDLAAWRAKRHLKTVDVIDTLKPRFPRYASPVNSMVEHPENYGVQLIPEAVNLLEDTWDESGQKRAHADTHKLKDRLSFRLTKVLLRRFRAAIEASGYDTVQAALTALVERFISEHEQED